MYIPYVNILDVLGGVAWAVFWDIVRFWSTPWDRVVLLTALLTHILVVLEVFLLIAFLT